MNESEWEQWIARLEKERDQARIERDEIYRLLTSLQRNSSNSIDRLQSENEGLKQLLDGVTNDVELILAKLTAGHIEAVQS